MSDVVNSQLAKLREQLPAGAKRNVKTFISNAAPLCTRYLCEIEINGRVVATGEAYSHHSAESCAIRALLVLVNSFGLPTGVS